MEELVSLRMGVGLTTKKFGLMKAMMPHVNDLFFSLGQIGLIFFFWC
jgi:hypothetical protein